MISGRIFSWVSISVSVLVATFADRLKFVKKSAPSVGVLTSICIKIHEKLHQMPKFNACDFPLYVLIFVPFPAWTLYSTGVKLFFVVREITLILAPGSTKNSYP